MPLADADTDDTDDTADTTAADAYAAAAAALIVIRINGMNLRISMWSLHMCCFAA